MYGLTSATKMDLATIVQSAIAVGFLLALVAKLYQEYMRRGRGIRITSMSRHEVQFFAHCDAQQTTCYGYGGNIDEIRKVEFPLLGNLAYLDFAGASLPSAEQLKQVSRHLAGELSGTLYSNPHNGGKLSAATNNEIALARDLVLSFFRTTASQYDLVWTRGATDSLSILAEAFPWTASSSFKYVTDVHTSVLGIRELAPQWECVSNRTIHALLDRIASSTKDSIVTSADSETTYSLFAFPAECNFSGSRYDLRLVRAVESAWGAGILNKDDTDAPLKARYLTVLDAAKYCSTSQLDLTLVNPSFCVLSFYKLFGYPTGLGALLVRKDVGSLLNKRYFGGGTVSVVSALGKSSDPGLLKTRRKDALHSAMARLEDGTPHYLGIVSLQHGFSKLNALGMDSIEKHTRSLALFLSRKLMSLRHEATGSPLVKLYGNWDGSSGLAGHVGQGPVVTFNLLQSDSTFIGFSEVNAVLQAASIQVRTGCMCNPGACQFYMGITPLQVASNAAVGKVCGDDLDIIDGQPTGAVRVSFGYPSSIRDVARLLDVLEDNFLERLPRHDDAAERCQAWPRDSVQEVTVSHIYLYPIKSCRFLSVVEWPLEADGTLLYDRSFAVVTPSGTSLTQKSDAKMASISAAIDLARHILTVSAPGMPDLLLDLASGSVISAVGCGDALTRGEASDLVSFAVCSDCRLGRPLGETMSWFSSYLQRPCLLARQAYAEAHEVKSFANVSPLLLVSQASVDDVSRQLGRALHAVRFRPNLVVQGCEAYAEEGWDSVSVASGVRLESLGCAERCSMIDKPQGGNLDAAEGRRGIGQAGGVLATLAKHRRVGGKVNFGVKLTRVISADPTATMLRQGMRVYAHTK